MCEEGLDRQSDSFNNTEVNNFFNNEEEEGEDDDGDYEEKNDEGVIEQEIEVDLKMGTSSNKQR